MEFYGLIGADLRRSKYLDWDKGISAFAKNGFDEILKLLKQESEIKIGGAESVRNGEVLAYYYPMSNPLLLYYALAELGDLGNVIGFPTQQGGESFFAVDGLLVINQKSERDKEIEEFLEYVFSLSNQTSDVNFFSIRSDAAEYALDEKNDEKNSSDVKCVWRYGKWNKKDNAVAIPLSGSKEELTKAYESFMQSLISDQTEEEVINVIWEETDAYLGGGKSAEETVKSIDRRVQLYFDER